MSAPVYVGKHIAGRWHRAHCVCYHCTRDGLPRYEAVDFAEQFGFLKSTQAPVAVVPSSPAVAVKAGGVATLTGGDTTQPETQR